MFDSKIKGIAQLIKQPTHSLEGTECAIKNNTQCFSIQKSTKEHYSAFTKNSTLLTITSKTTPRSKELLSQKRVKFSTYIRS